jgi:hypothetical protein
MIRNRVVPLLFCNESQWDYRNLHSSDNIGHAQGMIII